MYEFSWVTDGSKMKDDGIMEAAVLGRHILYCLAREL